MAYLDPDSGAITLRVLYDGAAGAGKTTNVRVLHETLLSARAGELLSPGSTSRRTEFFDWRAFDAGYIDERRLRVQVLAVPGQWALRARRRLLLRAADAVCFVADASGRLGAQARMLASLRAARPDLVPSLVLQLNKTDLPSAVSPREACEALGLPIDTHAITACAHARVGVAETFSLLSRAAVANVRAAGLGALATGGSSAADAEELHQEIQALEGLSWRADHDVEHDWSEGDG